MRTIGQPISDWTGCSEREDKVSAVTEMTPRLPESDDDGRWLRLSEASFQSSVSRRSLL